eukprot:1598591-Rhodomonas_salina.1
MSSAIRSTLRPDVRIQSGAGHYLSTHRGAYQVRVIILAVLVASDDHVGVFHRVDLETAMLVAEVVEGGVEAVKHLAPSQPISQRCGPWCKRAVSAQTDLDQLHGRERARERA